MRFVFEGFSIDTDKVELKKIEQIVPVEPQVFDLLVYLIANRDHVVSQDQIFEEVWAGRAVSLSALTSRINAARAAVGDTGAEQRLIKTISRKGYRFVGEVSEAAELARAPASPALHQDIQFTTSSDGVTIAFARVGKGDPVVKAGNWLNHLEYDWESPVWSHMLRWLARQWELIRYDARGNGLSDWNAPDISFDAFVRDLEAVVDAAGVDKFVLFGASQGAGVSIAYAVKHPDRVKKLILYGGFACGRQLRGSPDDVAQAEAMLTLMRTGWGQENPAFRQVFTSLFVPGGTPEQMSWFNDLQRKTTSPENAVRIRKVSDFLDVRTLLPLVTVPTLVLHCRNDVVQPFEEGRLIAAGIPHARFVGLDGGNHLILETDPGWTKFMAEVEAFIAA